MQPKLVHKIQSCCESFSIKFVGLALCVCVFNICPRTSELCFLLRQTKSDFGAKSRFFLNTCTRERNICTLLENGGQEPNEREIKLKGQVHAHSKVYAGFSKCFGVVLNI